MRTISTQTRDSFLSSTSLFHCLVFLLHRLVSLFPTSLSPAPLCSPLVQSQDRIPCPFIHQACRLWTHRRWILRANYLPPWILTSDPLCLRSCAFSLTVTGKVSSSPVCSHHYCFRCALQWHPPAFQVRLHSVSPFFLTSLTHVQPLDVPQSMLRALPRSPPGCNVTLQPSVIYDLLLRRRLCHCLCRPETLSIN